MEEAIQKLKDLIQFGWDFVDSEAADIYEKRINEVIGILEKG